MRSGPTATKQQYKEVRSLTRGVEVLKALNQLPGGIASTTQLSRACAIDRTTTKRLLETLRSLGLVRQGDRNGQYYLTFEVRRLSEGFQDEAWVARVASPMMHASVRELVWPCDLATAEGGFMVVRESTHRWSALSQHRAMIGEKMPILVTAVGRAYLAACDDAEREALLELLRLRADAWSELARDGRYVRRVVNETRKRGYAYNDGEWAREADFAGVAVPVYSGERLLAALNMVFPKSAVAAKDLKGRFVPALKRLSDSIGKASKALEED